MTGYPYFAQPSEALRAAGIQKPCLVLALDRLNGNVATIKFRVAPGLQIRIVSKSLPCPSLLAHIRTALKTDLVMTVHFSVNAAVAQGVSCCQVAVRQADIGGAWEGLTKGALVDPGRATSHIVWVIDTDERLASNGRLADDLGIDLRFCFEVDVGRHRGGYRNPDALLLAVKALQTYPRLHCQGRRAESASMPFGAWRSSRRSSASF